MNTDTQTQQTASAPETRSVDADGKTWDERFATSHQGRVHALNMKRKAKREAEKARRTIPAEKPTAILTESDAWADDYRRLQAHADKLGEALRLAINVTTNKTLKSKLQEALAAYEDAQ